MAEITLVEAVNLALARAMAEDDGVLVLGEDGTGKTLAARLIHDRSDRGNGPLIAVNCRDLAPGLGLAGGGGAVRA